MGHECSARLHRAGSNPALLGCQDRQHAPSCLSFRAPCILAQRAWHLGTRTSVTSWHRGRWASSVNGCTVDFRNRFQPQVFRLMPCSGLNNRAARPPCFRGVVPFPPVCAHNRNGYFLLPVQIRRVRAWCFKNGSGWPLRERQPTQDTAQGHPCETPPRDPSYARFFALATSWPI